MALNVILGKSNTGKSEYMYKKIMALLLCLTFLTLVGCKTQGDVSSSAPEESKP